MTNEHGLHLKNAYLLERIAAMAEHVTYEGLELAMDRATSHLCPTLTPEMHNQSEHREGHSDLHDAVARDLQVLRSAEHDEAIHLTA